MSSDIPTEHFDIYATKTCVSCGRIRTLNQFAKIHNADGTMRYSDICTSCDRTGAILGKNARDSKLLNTLREKGIDAHLSDTELLDKHKISENETDLEKEEVEKKDIETLQDQKTEIKKPPIKTSLFSQLATKANTDLFSTNRDKKTTQTHTSHATEKNHKESTHKSQEKSEHADTSKEKSATQDHHAETTKTADIEHTTTTERNVTRRDGDHATRSVNEAARQMRFGGLLAAHQQQSTNQQGQAKQSGEQNNQKLSQEFKDALQKLTPPTRPGSRR